MLTFVNAHLAAFDEMYEKRNQDFHELFPSVPEGDYLIEGASSPSSLRLVLRHRTNI